MGVYDINGNAVSDELTNTVIGPIEIVCGAVQGNNAHTVSLSNEMRSLIYEVEPSTEYRFLTLHAPARFQVGTFAQKPNPNDSALQYWSYNNQTDPVDFTLTTGSTIHYIMVYYWNKNLDSDDPITLSRKVYLTKNDNNDRGAIQFVNDNNAKIDVLVPDYLEPDYIIDQALIYGAGDHDIRSDQYSKIAVYRLLPGYAYRVETTALRPRMNVGVFDERPAIGSVPVYASNNGGQKEFTVPGNASGFYLGIYFFNSAVEGSSDYQSALNTIKVSGYNNTSVEGAFKRISDSISALMDDSNNEFNIVTWNIGHFAMGVHTDTDITDADFNDKLKAFCDRIYSCKADIFTVNEYSRIFANTTNEDVLAEDVLFPDFKYKYIGEQRHYSCNAIFSNLPVRNREVRDYECMANETITHTTLIEAQDSYYIEWDTVLCGVSVHCISTHLVFDTNRPDVLQQAQIEELLDVCDGYDHVIIMGDMNTSNVSAFVTAGYDVVSEGTPSVQSGIDNIIVKGLTLRTKVGITGTDLSDHNIRMGLIKIS